MLKAVTEEVQISVKGYATKVLIPRLEIDRNFLNIVHKDDQLFQERRKDTSGEVKKKQKNTFDVDSHTKIIIKKYFFIFIKHQRYYIFIIY